MTSSHADSHDLDKLARWYRDLSLNPPNPPSQRYVLSEAEGGVRGDFPVYAVFLVSEADRPAHGIFREFRTRFDAWSAGFDHLVIFGQHGLSSTVHGLLNGFGLPLEAVPALVLFSSPLDCQAYTLPLGAPGSGGSTPMNTGPSAGGMLQAPAEDEPWRHTLKLIEAVVDRGEKSLDLTSLPLATRLHLDGGPVVELVAMLLRH